MLTAEAKVWLLATAVIGLVAPGAIGSSDGLEEDMGMICYVLRFSPEQAGVLKAQPASTGDLMERASTEKRGDATMAAGEQLQPYGDLASALCLEKSWHLLHYLFTGDVGPVGGAGDALLAGEEVGEDIGGYGAPRWLTPRETVAFAQFLNGLDVATLAGRIDLKDMAEAGVYGTPFGAGAERDLPALRKEVAHFLPLLRDYVGTASEKGDGLLLWII